MSDYFSEDEKISEKKEKVLREINKEQWNTMYEKAKAYYRKHGNLPIGTKPNRQLYTWLMRQKFFFRNGKLPFEQIKMLDDLEIDWNVQDKQWYKMYSKAAEYYSQEQGNDNLALNVADAEQYYKWLNETNEKFRNGELIVDQVEMLKRIGIDYTVKTVSLETLHEIEQLLRNKKGNIALDKHGEVARSYLKVRNTILDEVRRTKVMKTSPDRVIGIVAAKLQEDREFVEVVFESMREFSKKRKGKNAQLASINSTQGTVRKNTQTARNKNVEVVSKEVMNARGDNKIAEDPERAQMLAKIYSMIADGHSKPEVHNYLLEQIASIGKNPLNLRDYKRIMAILEAEER